MEGKRTCVVHCVEKEDSDILLLTNTRWEKIKTCAKEWVLLDGPERDRADLLIKKDSFCDATDGYHVLCYNSFTNKARLIQAEKRKEKGTTERKPSPLKKTKKKRLRQRRSSSVSTTASGSTTSSRQQRSQYVLPNECIICKKDRWSKKTSFKAAQREKLIQVFI